MVRRTKKEFKPYNDYVDRPFELKWLTAFPLGELQAAIKEILKPAIEEINLKIDDMELEILQVRYGSKVIQIEIYNN